MVRAAKDITSVNDARATASRRSPAWLALARNYDPLRRRAFQHVDLMRRFDKAFGATGRDYGKVSLERTSADIESAGRTGSTSCSSRAWFQDLFNYDFRRTERCIIPYATGGRNQLAPTTRASAGGTSSRRCMTATLTKCGEEHGCREIFAGGKNRFRDGPAQPEPRG